MRYLLSKFRRRSLMIFIIKDFRTIVFIFIVISRTFWSICPPAFFRCLSNSGTFTELRTTSFIESTGVTCSDSVSHNRVQVLSIPVLLLACSQDWTSNLQMIVSWLYTLQRNRTPPKSRVLCMILNYMWSSSSGVLRSLEYSFIAITPRSTLTRSSSTC